ncbi:hypothetical protein Nmel_003977, partial [Mimus melanotis]
MRPGAPRTSKVIFTAQTTGRSGIRCKILWTGCISLERAGSPRPPCPRPLVTPPGAATVTGAPLHETHLLRDQVNSQTRPTSGGTGTARHGTAHLPSAPRPLPARALPAPRPP